MATKQKIVHVCGPYSIYFGIYTPLMFAGFITIAIY